MHSGDHEHILSILYTYFPFPVLIQRCEDLANTWRCPHNMFCGSSIIFSPIDKWPKGEIDDLWSTDECNGCLTHCPVWLGGVVCGDWKLYPSAPWFSHQIICLPWQLDWNSLHPGAQKVRFSIRKAAFCLRHDARYDLTPWEMNLITNILATIHFEYFMRWPEIWQ